MLRRLAHPFWFQSFGAVMGMDWHSSGITTGVIGALKRGLTPVQQELGIYVCGGKGAKSRNTPLELSVVGDRTGLDATPLETASRLVAKVDSAAVQDGYDLYLHAFIVSAEGRWCVVQHGHPFPVPLKVYDQTIRVLKDAVGRAKLGNDERLAAIRQLDAQARALEGRVIGPSFDEFISEERANAAEYGGRTVFDGR